MYFVGVFRHTPEACPSNYPEGFTPIVDPKHIAECGVRHVGSYTAPPEHTSFHIVEADSYEAVIAYFRPVMTIGSVDVIPVRPLTEEEFAVHGAHAGHSLPQRQPAAPRK